MEDPEPTPLDYASKGAGQEQRRRRRKYTLQLSAELLIGGLITCVFFLAFIWLILASAEWFKL